MRSYVTFVGLGFTNHAGLSYENAMLLRGTGVTVSNCWYSMPGAGYAITSDTGVTNLTLTGLSITNCGNYSLYVYGTTNEAVSILNTYIESGKAVWLKNTHSPIISNVTHKSALAADGALKLSACSGVLTLDGYTCDASAAYGVVVSGCPFDAGSVITNTLVSNAANIGFYILNSAGITVTNSTCAYGASTGFQCGPGSSNIVFGSNQSLSNSLYGFLISDGSLNVSLSGNRAAYSTNQAGFTVSGSPSGVTNVTFSGNTSEYNGNAGFNALSTASLITYSNDIARFNADDGFSTANYVHDVTYTTCSAYGNGSKASTANGDGFTAHDTNYNINVRYSLSYSNTASGFAFVGKSAGTLYNSVGWQNAGDWSGSGGVDQIRGGMYFSLAGNNPVSANSWVITNCIFGLNYPREVRMNGLPGGATCPIALDYNCYWPTDSNVFASLDDGVSDISWTTYHTTDGYEGSSLNTDPRFRSGGYIPVWCSAVVDTGVDVGLTTDYLGNPIVGTPDRGAYEYQHKSTLMTVGGRTISVPQ